MEEPTLAMNTLEIAIVTRGAKVAKILLEQVKPELDALNILYDAGGGAKETIDQAGLDGRPEFSGLTKAQLDDGMFALTSTTKTALTNTFTQLEQLAARAPGG